MFVSYVVVAAVAAAMNLWAASLALRQAETPVQNAVKLQVPLTWVAPLGVLLLAGAVGLLAGIAVPALGTAAAIGLILYFVCAMFAHLRIGWYATLPFPAMFLALAAAALALRLRA